MTSTPRQRAVGALHAQAAFGLLERDAGRAQALRRRLDQVEPAADQLDVAAVIATAMA